MATPKKSKTGPKPLPESQRLRHVLCIRVRDAQMDAINEAAVATDRPVSEWLLERALRGLKVK